MLPLMLPSLGLGFPKPSGWAGVNDLGTNVWSDCISHSVIVPY